MTVSDRSSKCSIYLLTSLSLIPGDSQVDDNQSIPALSAGVTTTGEIDPLYQSISSLTRPLASVAGEPSHQMDDDQVADPGSITETYVTTDDHVPGPSTQNEIPVGTADEDIAL